jgi:hypothetical protein
MCVKTNTNKCILSHLAYINYKLNMLHVISPDNTRRNIVEFKQKFYGDIVFFLWNLYLLLDNCALKSALLL